MYTLENSQSRLQAGLEELPALIESHGANQIVLRSVHDPSRQRMLASSGMVDAGSWQAQVGRSSLPGPALLAGDSEHWLITDGASEDIRRWASRAPLNRVIGVGAGTENAAITRLAARRDEQSASRIAVLVDVVNRGTKATRRELRVLGSHGAAQEFAVELAAGETRQITLTLATARETLSARLEPPDTLVIDDEISLDLKKLTPVATVIDPACPATLHAALKAHPGLNTSTNGQAMLAIQCSAAKQGDMPRILFHPGPGDTLASAPVWLPKSKLLQNLFLRTEWIQAGDWPHSPAASDEVLLRAGEQPLIIRRAGDATIESVIDPGYPLLTEQPEFAVLLAGMIDVVLDRNVLDPVLIAHRDPHDSDIAPHAIETQGGKAAELRLTRKDFMDWLLALALLLLLLDLALLVRAARGTEHA